MSFEPIKQEYQYGQTIELQGKAMMFSGVPLNATVNYEIKKQNIVGDIFGGILVEMITRTQFLASKINEKVNLP